MAQKMPIEGVVSGMGLRRWFRCSWIWGGRAVASPVVFGRRPQVAQRLRPFDVREYGCGLVERLPARQSRLCRPRRPVAAGGTAGPAHEGADGGARARSSSAMSVAAGAGSKRSDGGDVSGVGVACGCELVQRVGGFAAPYDLRPTGQPLIAGAERGDALLGLEAINGVGGRVGWRSGRRFSGRRRAGSLRRDAVRRVDLRWLLLGRGVDRGRGRQPVVRARAGRCASSTAIKPFSTSGKASRRAKLRARIWSMRRG